MVITLTGFGLQSCNKQTTTTTENKKMSMDVASSYPTGLAFKTFPSMLYAKTKFQQVVLIGSCPCIPINENCAPVVVIKGGTKAQMDDAFSTLSGKVVANFFSKESNALAAFPDWNTKYFSDVKTAILSGKYSFLKASESTYLMGETGKVSRSNFILAFPYEVR